ncbi:unnamed protein product (macronuclear) [Paramecium tetraurelia]|uniref:EF-hand domain-containing protein n=1 Tax=Paramecium tetraurelia TaxID=5888 RepID=A0D477_PARTE|nr:uncharacterized protein GSPATT00013310001 [Paramecium tetraurelia]CAK77844.1 unnamed protein product [Paramecium tetraurelia]|eukprot:XP_001445241.1 hypothetical protein (macronuclear) [Paramecium tetraurelia strain d4-2]
MNRKISEFLECFHCWYMRCIQFPQLVQMLMLSISQIQKSPQVQSSTKLNRFNLFSRNRTLDNTEASRMRSKYIIHDKESLYEEIQNLKQENNQLKLALRQFQSQNQYFKREVQSILKEESTPFKNNSRLKQGFLEKITRLEDNNIKLQQQLQEQISYINQLQSPMNKNNVEGLCISLSEDNMKMTQLISQLEQSVTQQQNNCNKMNIKYNAILNKYKQLKNLNAQLLLEMAELKKKDTLFLERPQQKDNKKMEEQLQLGYDQAMVDLRNERQKNKYLENQMQKLQADNQEQIENLEKRMAEQKRQFETLQREYELEKQSKYQPKRTILIKNNGPQPPEEQGQLQEDIELQKKKFINVDKNDILAIARQVKQNLIGLKISLQQVETYLLTDEVLTQQQLKQNLSNRIFGLKSIEQVEMAAIYLADVENETETTTSARVRSIFRTLMENYQILSIEQLNNINQQIMKKKNEISDILIRKYPDTYTSGYITIDAYLEVLSSVEIQLSKIEIDHFYALILRQNRSSRIFLQQIHSPFDVNQEEDDLEDQHQNINLGDVQPESLKLSNSEILIINNRKESEFVNLIEDDVDHNLRSNQRKIDKNIEKLEEQNEDEFKLSQKSNLELSEEEKNPFQDVQHEESDVKMIDSQELRKQSQPDLQQF